MRVVIGAGGASGLGVEEPGVADDITIGSCHRGE